MNTIRFRATTEAESAAMRGWLADHGVQVGPDATEIHASQLAGSKISLGALSAAAAKAGHPGEVGLEALRRATTIDPANAKAGRAREIAGLTLKNALSATSSLTRDMETFARGWPPPDDAVSKLQARLKKLANQISDLQRPATLAYLDPVDYGPLRVAGAELIEAHSRLAASLADQTALRPSYRHKLDEIAEHAHSIGRCLRPFAEREALLTADATELRREALKSMGLTAEVFDRRFSIDRVETAGYPHAELRSRAPFDLDLSGRGLRQVVTSQWRAHRGDLDLSNNEIASASALPQHVEGTLSLRNNAFTTLRSFDASDVVIDGDLDLSKNRNLRSLEGLDGVVVRGDLDLRDVPATSPPFAGLKVGGKIILDAGQTELISALEGKIQLEIVGQAPAKAPFVVPADPTALVLDVDAASKLDAPDLARVLAQIPHGERGQLFQAMLAIGQGIDARAHKALMIASKIDPLALRLTKELDLIPARGKPMPAAISELPTWKLIELCADASRADILGKRAKGRQDREEVVAELLLERVRAGELISSIPCRSAWAREDSARPPSSILDDAAFEFVGRLAQSTREEKGELYVTLEGLGELPAAILFRRFGGARGAYQALERVMQRMPESSALGQIYQHLQTHTYGDGLSFSGGADALRAALVREQVDVLAHPSAAVAESLATIRGLGRTSTLEEARAATKVVRDRVSSLNEAEAGAVLADLYTQSRYELSRNADPRVHLESLGLAVELLPRVGGDRNARSIDAPVQALLELLRDHPSVRPSAAALLGRVFDACDRGYVLAHALFTHSASMSKTPDGAKVLEAQVTRIFDRLDDRRSLEAVRWAFSTFTPLYEAKKAAVRDLLPGLALDGERAEIRDAIVASYVRP